MPSFVHLSTFLGDGVYACSRAEVCAVIDRFP